MCFSAGASFVASGALGGAGLVTISKTKRFRAIALIPVLFSVQQFTEGLQWLSPHPSQLSLVLGYIFLFFAYLFWPIYIPFAARSVEPSPKRRKLLFGFIIAGSIITAYLLAALLTQPLSVSLMERSVDYQLYLPLRATGLVWYLIVVCGSLFLSSHRFLKLFGALALFMALVSYIIFLQTFTSVWCFFGAVLSLFLVFGIKRVKV